MADQVRFDFSGKHALVTGGAQGIGFEIARRFLDAGARITLWDASQEAMNLASEELAHFGSRVTVRLVNIADHNACVAAAAAVGVPVDILVNNAGITRDKTFTKMTTVEFNDVINVNLTGAFNVTKALFDHFSDGTSRRIINMSSVVGLYGNFGQSNYAAAKAGLVGMTRSLARELGRKGFTVNCIAPGFIRTKMTAAMPADVLRKMEEKVPAGFLGEVSDIANCCLWLASDAARYVNGTVLSVDGGLTL